MKFAKTIFRGHKALIFTQKTIFIHWALCEQKWDRLLIERLKENRLAFNWN